VDRVKKSAPKAITELSVETVRPRFAASVLTGIGVVSSFRGVYARVARKLKVSPSMVSRVADGHRISPKIQAALREELHAIKQKLDSIFLRGLNRVPWQRQSRMSSVPFCSCFPKLQNRNFAWRPVVRFMRADIFRGLTKA
jgi:hypothetical protein